MVVTRSKTQPGAVKRTFSNAGLIDADDSDGDQPTGYNDDNSSSSSSSDSDNSTSDTSDSDGSDYNAPVAKRPRQLPKQTVDRQGGSDTDVFQQLQAPGGEDNLIQQPHPSGKPARKKVCRIPYKIGISEYLARSPNISDCRLAALKHDHLFKERGAKKRVTANIAAEACEVKRRKVVTVPGDVIRSWARNPVPEKNRPLRPKQERCLLRPELLDMKPSTLFLEFMSEPLKVRSFATFFTVSCLIKQPLKSNI